ncbi:hypothetical protein [Roseibium sp. RKSG952]|uniref:hypothetical protein n=1 Tax=Roseibium sp. RKSG952 TaxID=2529384 RepID=UPI0012BCE23F|nr:hypothetical protein [Roseibium sp. RKSG952]MTH96634.1 hypothetical protein [Roseibium sp. RKSG952]
MTDINNKEDDFGSLGDFVTDDEDSAKNKFGAADDDFDPANFGGLDDDDDAPEIEGIAGPGEAGFDSEGFGSDGFDEDDDNDAFGDPFAAAQDDDGFGGSDDEGDEDPFAESDTSSASEVDVDFEGNDEFSGLDNADQPDDDFDPEDSIYAGGAQDADNDNSAEDEAPKKGPLSKLIVPVGGVIAVSVLGLVAYTQLLPMFSGGSQPPAVNPPAVATNTQGFPTQLPSLDTLPTAPATSNPLPNLAQPLTPPASSVTDLPDFGTPAASPSTEPLLSPPGSMTATSVPGFPAMTPEATQHPVAMPAAAVPSALESVDVDRLNQILEIDFDATSSEIDRLQVQVAGLESTISGLERKIKDLSDKMSVAPTVSAPGVSMSKAPMIDAIQPKLKPEVIQGVRLTGYSPKSGRAWVKVEPDLMGPDGPPSGRMVVEKGDDVPGAGEFVTVRRYNGRSIMVTSNGFVME